MFISALLQTVYVSEKLKSNYFKMVPGKLTELVVLFR
jgi:hypothetical protein